ncbi:unnamed protein product, partial [Durusdinium trenchii]
MAARSSSQSSRLARLGRLAKLAPFLHESATWKYIQAPMPRTRECTRVQDVRLLI